MTNLWGPTTNKGHLLIKILLMTMGFSWQHSMRWFFLSTGLKWNVEMLVFVEGGKPRNLYKNPWSKDIPTHIPHMTPGLGIEPVEQQGGECSCHSTIPSFHSVTMQGFATSIVIFGSSTKDGTQIITKIDGQNIFHTICHPYNSGWTWNTSHQKTMQRNVAHNVMQKCTIRKHNYFVSLGQILIFFTVAWS